MNKILLSLLIFLGVMGSALADGPIGPVVAHATVRGQDVPVYQIGEVEDAVGAGGMDAFAEKVAVVLHDWTRTHGVEAIGLVCKSTDGARWGSVLLTIGAHTTSPVTNACPDGMASTGITIHSHPQRHRYHVNAVDRLFLHDGLRAETTISTWPDQYSPEDFAAGPGYLVGQINLHYQDGPGHVRIVERL